MQSKPKVNISRFRSVSAASFAIFLAACSETPGLEGKYREADGSAIEFTSDGTLVIVTSTGKQSVWQWSKLDNSRIKIDPGPGLLNPPAGVCGYTATGDTVRLTGCPFATTLTRL
ncbi:hypothetical protein [Rhizobium sp. KDH_Rht_773_N]